MGFSIPSTTILKWIGAGAVAAIVSTVGFLTNFADPLVEGLVMIAVGVVILAFIDTKKLGMAVVFPAGLIVAGSVTLANKFVVPLIPNL